MTMQTYQISVFETPLCWLGIVGSDGELVRIKLGQKSEESVIRSVVVADQLSDARIESADWNPELKERLTRYAKGEPVNFEGVALRWPRPLPPFRRRVIAETRRIPWGTTLSYGEIARRAGSGGAARAVGSAMATNRFPIVVPCHRVVGAAGRLGGFSAPGGLNLKQRMLALEDGGDTGLFAAAAREQK